MSKRIITLTILLCLIAPATASARYYGPRKTRRIVSRVAKHYGLPLSERLYLRKTAVDIIYALPGKPAHESGGSTLCGRGNSCVGLMQFNGGWHFNAYEKRAAKRAGRERPEAVGRGEPVAFRARLQGRR